MDTQTRVENVKLTEKIPAVPQLRVRSDVRSGDDLATCQNNVAKWQQRYYDAYNKAHSMGCI